MVLLDEIVNYLKTRNFQCIKSQVIEKDTLTVSVIIGKQKVNLSYFYDQEITSLPTFWLKEPLQFMPLAHVNIRNISGVDFGWICVNDADSVSVNYEQPLLAIEESLIRHIALLTKSLLNPDWNRSELLREFQSNWIQLCLPKNKQLLAVCTDVNLQESNVLRPLKGSTYGFDSYYMAEISGSNSSKIGVRNWSTNIVNRTTAGKAIVIPLNELEPAPFNKKGLGEWYLNAMENLLSNKPELFRKFGQWRSKEFWLILNAETPSGRTWFCLHLESRKKHSLPKSKEALEHWKLQVVNLKLFNKDKVLPRGGANLKLAKKRVALVGAGSVGSEIALKLSSAGIENLDIYDPDNYSLDNLYRHVLSENSLDFPKSMAMSFMIKNRLPWSNATGFPGKLLDLRMMKNLKNYDLIVVAIGSPTHERLFKEHLVKNKIKVPVINTWLEGFGVGGHSIIDIPDSKGCLYCAYVCHETFTRGLSSNLNFIESNQNVTKNLAGCGEQFISYGALCSAQTALIATDLAIRFLEKRLLESSKVSWKGDYDDAKENGINMTHRYIHFNESLRVEPLYDEDCDVCN